MLTFNIAKIIQLFSSKANKLRITINYFPEKLRIRLISARLERVLSHTEKSCIASYKTISTNIKIKVIKLLHILLTHAFGFNIIIFNFHIPRKLSKTMR